MEKKYFPSEIGRLVYGYLQSKGCSEAADIFLETSKSLEECRQMKEDEGTFETKINGQTIETILHEHSKICEIIDHQAKCVTDPNVNLSNKKDVLKYIMQEQIDRTPEIPGDKQAICRTMNDNSQIRARSVVVNPMLNVNRSSKMNTVPEVNHTGKQQPNGFKIRLKPSSFDGNPVFPNKVKVELLRNKQVEEAKNGKKCSLIRKETFPKSQSATETSIENNIVAANSTISNSALSYTSRDVQSCESADLNDAVKALRISSSDGSLKISHTTTTLSIKNSNKDTSGEQTYTPSSQETVPVENDYTLVFNKTNEQEHSTIPRSTLLVENKQFDSGYHSVLHSTPIEHCCDIAQYLTSAEQSHVCVFLHNMLHSNQAYVVHPRRATRPSHAPLPCRTKIRKPSDVSIAKNNVRTKFKRRAMSKRRVGARERRRSLHLPSGIKQASEMLRLDSFAQTSQDIPLDKTLPQSSIEQKDPPHCNDIVDLTEERLPIQKQPPEDLTSKANSEITYLTPDGSQSQLSPSLTSLDQVPVEGCLNDDMDEKLKTPEKMMMDQSNQVKVGTLDELDNYQELHKESSMDSTPEVLATTSFMQINERLTEVTITPVQNIVPVTLIAYNEESQLTPFIFQLPDMKNVSTISPVQPVAPTAYVRPLKALRPKLVRENENTTEILEAPVTDRTTACKTVGTGTVASGCKKKASELKRKSGTIVPKTSDIKGKNLKESKPGIMRTANKSTNSQSPNCLDVLRDCNMDKSSPGKSDLVNKTVTKVLTFDSDFQEFLIPSSSREVVAPKSVFLPVSSNSMSNTPSLPLNDNEILETTNLEHSDDSSRSIVSNLLNEEEFHTRLADLINEGFLNTPQKAISKSSIKDQLENVIKQVIEVTEKDPVFEEMLLDLLPLDENSGTSPSTQETCEQPQQNSNCVAIGGISDKYKDRMDELTSKLEDNSSKNTLYYPEEATSKQLDSERLKNTTWKTQVDGNTEKVNEQADSRNVKNKSEETQYDDKRKKIENLSAVRKDVTETKTDKKQNPNSNSSKKLIIVEDTRKRMTTIRKIGTKIGKTSIKRQEGNKIIPAAIDISPSNLQAPIDIPPVIGEEVGNKDNTISAENTEKIAQLHTNDKSIIPLKKPAKGNVQEKETPLFLKRTNIYSNFVDNQTKKNMIKPILPKTNTTILEKPTWDSYIRSFIKDDINKNEATQNIKKKRRNKRNIRQVDGANEVKTKCPPKKSKQTVNKNNKEVNKKVNGG